MTLGELSELCELLIASQKEAWADDDTWVDATLIDKWHALCKPEIVAALIRCVERADVMRGEGYEPRPGVARVQSYDAARAKLGSNLVGARVRGASKAD